MLDSHRFHEFLLNRVPWRIARLYYVVPGRLRRLLRRLRYKQPPKGGWGHGWRVLVFKQLPGGQELHVLAPVSGLEFDFDLLKRHVRGEASAGLAHRDGVRTADMAWAGHHIGVVNDEIGFQRIPMDKLIPGEFHGGVLDVGLTLINVLDPASAGDGGRSL